MNALILLLHIIVIIVFSLIALRIGKQALIALIITQAILVNLFITKQMDLFGFTITCCDAFIVGSVFCVNLLTEYFGKKEAKRALIIAFFILAFVIAMSTIHLAYLPSPFDNMQDAFKTILSPFPRVAIASFAVFVFVMFLNTYLYSFIKKHNDSLILRMGLSLILVQVLDTALFTIIALYGIVHSVSNIILISCLIKIIASIITAPFVTLSKHLIKK